MMNAPRNAFALKKTYYQAINALRSRLGLSAQGSIRNLVTGGNDVRFGNAKSYAFQAEAIDDGIKIHRGWIFYRGQTIYFPTQTFANTDAVFLRFDVEVTATEIVVGEAWEIYSETDSVFDPVTMVSRPLDTSSTLCEIRNPVDFDITVTPGTVFVPIAIRDGSKIRHRRTTNQSWAISSNGDLLGEEN